MEHPICEICLSEGRITPAEHIHHKIEYLSGKTERERLNLFYDVNNLQCLCSECHRKIHAEKHRKKYR